jgi:hypothetical protein
MARVPGHRQDDLAIRLPQFAGYCPPNRCDNARLIMRNNSGSLPLGRARHAGPLIEGKRLQKNRPPLRVPGFK